MNPNKHEVLYAIQQFVPNAKISVKGHRLYINTGLTLDANGTVFSGVCTLPKDRSAFEIGQEAAKDIFQALNWMGQENECVKGFMEVVQKEHRTLQQNFGHLLISAINHFAEMHEKGWMDARNQGICELCSKLKPVADEARLPFI